MKKLQVTNTYIKYDKIQEVTNVKSCKTDAVAEKVTSLSH